MRIGFELHRSGFHVLSIDWFSYPDIGMRSYFLTICNLTFFISLDDESKYPGAFLKGSLDLDKDTIKCPLIKLPFSEDKNNAD